MFDEAQLRDVDMGEQESDSDSILSDNDSEFSEHSGILSFPEVAEADEGDKDEEEEEMDEGDEEEEEMDESDEDEVQALEPLLASVRSLQKTLLGSYQCPSNPDAEERYGRPLTLTRCQELSLKHFIAWRKSNGTVAAYYLHAAVLKEASGEDILSLHLARKLAIQLTGLKAIQVDICPNSCLAYTGEYQDTESCPHFLKDEKRICGLPRFRQKKKPYTQMLYLPIMPSIKALFGNADTSRLLRHRDQCLKEVLHLLAQGQGVRKLSDFGDSDVHLHHYQNMGLFQEPRDIAFALSSDGAQLTLKKQSETWILVLMILNFPPELRSQSNNIIVPLSIPGPKPPKNMESFLYPFFQEMAKGSEGIWIWDALDSSYFIGRAHLCMILGDMLGSAKLNGMSGHSAIYGDRFSLVKGARSSLQRGSKAQYYPISPPANDQYNPDRPTTYNLDNLPLRTQDHYWATIQRLEQARTKTHKASISKETGISRMPLCVASPAFIHPSFFPLDPFHLFYENNAAFLWDLWTTISLPGERVHLGAQKAAQFGLHVSKAMSTLPVAFCGSIRDPFLKRQSQYKIYEWMALVHWYILPIGIELEFNPELLLNFSHFVAILEFAMTIKPRSEEELQQLHNRIKAFLIGFEKLYIGNDPSKISRARLCVFQLIHITTHIKWYGSIRNGSQATVERTIGEMGHKIHSKKAPFANLANIIYERELIKLLLLYYPALSPNTQTGKSQTLIGAFKQNIKLTKKERKSSQDFQQHLNAIGLWLNQPVETIGNLQRWGKFKLPTGSFLRSRLGESQGRIPERSASYFEGVDKRVIFGEALAFYDLVDFGKTVVAYRPLSRIKTVLGVYRGEWSEEIKILPVSSLVNLIGIWSSGERVYVLRKHPGLLWLSDEERGVRNDEEEE
jgi:Transposase family tnp2